MARARHTLPPPAQNKGAAERRGATGRGRALPPACMHVVASQHPSPPPERTWPQGNGYLGPLDHRLTTMLVGLTCCCA
jgi:hypothetical protein